MTTLGVIELYDAIKRSNGEYCKLCFRTADERKLVNPVSLKVFLSIVNSSSLGKGSEKVCYVCEARAAAALRLRHAVSLAMAIEELFEWLDAGRADLRNAVLQYLTGKQKSGGRVCRRAAQCDAALRRAGAGLARSDTLVVATECDAVAPPTKDVAEQTTDYGISTSAITVEESVRSALRARGIRSPGSDVTVLREQMRLRVHDPRDGKIELHPMVHGRDGNIYVPSLKLQVVDDNNLKSVSEQHLKLYTNAPLPLQTKGTNKNTNTQTNDVQNFLIIGSDFKNCSNATQTPNILNNMLNSKGRVPSNIQPLLSNIQSVPSNMQPVPSNIQPVLRNIQPVPTNIQPVPRNIQPVPRNIQRVPNKEREGRPARTELKRDATQPANGMTESKRPVLSMNGVDWENKIPMDVISFMDAMDPNPSERIMQPDPLPAPAAAPAPASAPAPMAVISDVRSVRTPDTTIDDDVMLIENVECIDLC